MDESYDIYADHEHFDSHEYDDTDDDTDDGADDDTDDGTDQK